MDKEEIENKEKEEKEKEWRKGTGKVDYSRGNPSGKGEKKNVSLVPYFAHGTQYNKSILRGLNQP